MANFVKNYKHFKIIRVSFLERMYCNLDSECSICRTLTTDDLFYVAAVDKCLCRTHLITFLDNKEDNVVGTEYEGEISRALHVWNKLPESCHVTPLNAHRSDFNYKMNNLSN